MQVYFTMREAIGEIAPVVDPLFAPVKHRSSLFDVLPKGRLEILARTLIRSSGEIALSGSDVRMT